MMKKLLVLGSVVGALVLTGAGCAGNPPVTQTNTQTESSSQPTGNLPASQEVKVDVTVQDSVKPKVVTKEIVIANFAFAPASVTVKAGTAITWVNDDEVVHNIKSDNGSFTNSTNLNTGNSYQFKFDKPGIYNYSCGLHPSMRGTIIVE